MNCYAECVPVLYLRGIPNMALLSRRRLFSLCMNRRLSFAASLFLIMCVTPNVVAWDNEDFELFDLVEEVQRNFYDVLGVERTASTAEIRKAYRKQSLALHPDKNKEDGAEENFRQLVAVAEVLKDADLRQRYDHILEHGLPDWREPIFYYRRVRKMGLLELAMLLFLIISVGHYLVIWSIYWERLLELESILPKKRKEKKSKKGSRQANAITTVSPENEDISSIPNEPTIPEDSALRPAKPQLTDALPCKLYRLIITTLCAAPSTLKQAKFELEMWRERRRLEAEQSEEAKEDEDDGKEKTKRRRKVQPTVYGEYQEASAVPVSYTPQKDTVEDANKMSNIKSGEWSQDEVTRLIRSMTKFPGGTSSRWEKIAQEISRPVEEVTKKAKQIKSGGYVVNVEASAQGITGAVQHTVSSKTGKTLTDDLTTSSPELPFEDEDENSQRKQRTPKPPKTSKRTLLISQTTGDHNSCCRTEDREEAARPAEGEGGRAGSWSQRQQKIFEKALTVYTKGVAERWDKIADEVPGKTKEECILRYKELVETIKRKKQSATQP